MRQEINHMFRNKANNNIKAMKNIYGKIILVMRLIVNYAIERIWKGSNNLKGL